MSINDIISKHYNELYRMLPLDQKTIYEGLTTEDILQNVIITTINKYSDFDVDEITGTDYLKKTLLMELKFSKKRIKNDKLLFTENIVVYDRNIED